MNEENATPKVDTTTEKQRGGITGKGFMPGESGNPAGRPKGKKNFDTVFFEALEKLAELNDKEGHEILVEIVSRGIKEARGGNFKFYNDLMSRLYGKPLQPMDVTTDGEKINQGTAFIIKDFSEDDNGVSGS